MKKRRFECMLDSDSFVILDALAKTTDKSKSAIINELLKTVNDNFIEKQMISLATVNENINSKYDEMLGIQNQILFYLSNK